MSPRETSRFLVGIGGGIAAYKVCDLISTLVKAGVEVRAMMTMAAQEFITPLTVSTLCRHPVYTDRSLWEPLHHRPLHIELGEWADVMLLAPLTANTLAKLVSGAADNLLTNTILASTCPILVAPAMNTTMWQQPAVQRNWQTLQENPRYHIIGPNTGLLACDTTGIGRMAESAEILPYLHSLLITAGKRDLAGKHLLISAGGTREHLDPVRFIGNPATGKMGVALAQAAWYRGATVRLVHGPLVGVTFPAEIDAIGVTHADQMSVALMESLPESDWVIMTAAVADVKPAQYSATKLPKAKLPTALPILPVPDLIQALSNAKHPHQQLIGFAAQTDDILPPAREKLVRKGLDAIVANPIDQPNSGFGSDHNQAIFLDRTGRQVPIPTCSKLHLAHRLLDLIGELDVIDSSS